MMTNERRPDTPFYPASVYNYGSRKGSSVDMIVLHTMEGYLLGTAAYFADSDANASAHFGVGARGEIIQFVTEDCAAWHAGNMKINKRSIGIEMEGYSNKPETFTPELLSSLVKLVGELLQKYGIPPDRASVVGHNEIPDARHPGLSGGTSHHVDPGPYFPWDKVMADLRALPRAAKGASNV